MSGWQAKRFWKTAAVTRTDDGFRIALDGRLVATPAKAPLTLPTQSMAEAIAAEWNAQDGKIDPQRMPVTRSANAAIDKVMPQFDEVVGLVAAYGASDLLCYRAPHPQELPRRQAEAWDPMLDWAERSYGVRLAVTSGISPIPQAPEHLALLGAKVRSFSAFELVALHDLVSISGSLVLGLAAAEGADAPEFIWSLSRIDELWQAEKWGQDDEAAEMAERKKSDFVHAHRFLALSRGQ